MHRAYFNDCAEVLLTVRLNRKCSEVLIGRGLLVAMEAVSKTVTLVVRESPCKSITRGTNSSLIPGAIYFCSVILLKGEDRVSIFYELQQVTVATQLSFYWNTKLLSSLSS